MKIFLYYKKEVNIENKFKLDIINVASDVFKISTGVITMCSLVPVDTIKYEGNSYDYLCVIDDSINDLSKFKESFSNELWLLVTKKLNGPLQGKVIYKTNFNPSDFAEKIKDFSNKEPEFKGTEEFDYKARSLTYVPVDPAYTFDRVILADETIKKIIESVNILKYENKVFKEWGLNVIQPNPSSALSFFGPSGTGKTMAAEAVANMLGKKILKVGYADIESKYHGEGPKMVKAIFLAAQNNDAVLFIDEADSLLSKRLTNVTQGSEQAINSMRSQLLICLEEFKGIVIFATNLVVNYDNAFLTRLISVEFKNPDKELRKKIWEVHVYETNNNGLKIPLDNDIDINKLSENFDFCGREIRKAVVSACVKAAMKNKDVVSMSELMEACKEILDEEKALNSNNETIHLINLNANETK